MKPVFKIRRNKRKKESIKPLIAAKKEVVV
jgi:hypothetical protein